MMCLLRFSECMCLCFLVYIHVVLCHLKSSHFLDHFLVSSSFIPSVKTLGTHSSSSTCTYMSAFSTFLSSYFFSLFTSIYPPVYLPICLYIYLILHLQSHLVHLSTSFRPGKLLSLSSDEASAASSSSSSSASAPASSVTFNAEQGRLCFTGVVLVPRNLHPLEKGQKKGKKGDTFISPPPPPPRVILSVRTLRSTGGGIPLVILDERNLQARLKLLFEVGK